MIMSHVTVRMEHVRRCGYCAAGVRDYFARFGIDYTAFIMNGIDADDLLRLTNNDALAQEVVEVARG